MAPLRIGIVQEGPVYLNLQHSLEKALIIMEEAAREGVQLLVFGESWLSGYPAWLDHCPDVALWDHEPVKAVYARMWKNGVAVPGPVTRRLCEAAARHGIHVVMGLNEIVPEGPGPGTIYNSFIVIDAEGKLVNHHRKLMPTFTEKMVYGLGDARGLRAVATPFGRLGGLICWEHWMPLSRQALHAQAELIHVALWPWVHEMHQVASRHYAFEGRCFVIAAGQIMRAWELPPELELPDHLRQHRQMQLLRGGSCVVAPNGHYLLPPQWEREGLIVAEIDDLEQPLRERLTLDVSGHYHRPDIFEFDWKEEG